MVLAVQLIVFGFTLWLGLYLLARNPAKPLLLLAALGLVAYALVIGLGTLTPFAEAAAWTPLDRIYRLLLIMPAVAWSGALFYLLPEESGLRERLLVGWSRVVLPLAGALALLLLAVAQPDVIYYLLALVVCVPLALGLVLIVQRRGLLRPRRPFALLLLASLFFGLGTLLLLLPFDLLSRDLAALLIAPDLLALGLAIGWLDAFDEGESLRADMLRSLLGSGLAAGVFALLIVLALLAGLGLSLPLLALLLATIAVAIALRVFAGALEAALNRIAFAGSPRLLQQQEELRVAASALPRLDAALDLAALDDAEFARLTRRALSHYGDLARLASNPLTNLPLITSRLAQRGATDDTLARAAELKALLAEAICRLKPRGEAPFGNTDEWRFYNALYFPYVRGLKPYSRRLDHADIDPVDREALDWFASTVPERTLYNWQTAGARLIAQDLRSRR